MEYLDLISRININSKNKSHNNAFYWYCERQDELNCNGRAVTRLVNGQHYLKSAKKHNHSAQASRVEVVKMIIRIKDQAQLTREKLSQVLQIVITDSPHKSEESYRQLFEELIDFSEEHNINLDPHIVLTDFEAAAINSVQLEFDDIQNKAEAGHVVRWFEKTFIYGRVRHTHINGNISRSEPLFSHTFWSVVNNIEHAYPRTQNSVKGWHRRWDILVGCAHAGIFRILKEIQKEQNRVELDIEAILQGALMPPQRRHNIKCEQCIQTVYNDRGNRSIMEYLHNNDVNQEFNQVLLGYKKGFGSLIDSFSLSYSE
ncbi:1650_t:CDS:2 [Gigaspora rosea]|nr:1650_t:CDS:2 [Gigaspora rosea]